MTSFVAHRRLLHPADAKLLRVSMTYVLPGLAVFYVVLAGLWLLPDIFLGCMATTMVNGRRGAPGHHGMGGFLDFSPFSPLSGTGSPFLPNLPWLNPGALALALPAPLPLRHLTSMLIYLAEFSASLYLLYRHLEFSREQSYLATILYISIFLLVQRIHPRVAVVRARAINAHEIAAMNVATIALIRVGSSGSALICFLGSVPCRPVRRICVRACHFRDVYSDLRDALARVISFPFKLHVPSCCGAGPPRILVTGVHRRGCRVIWLRWP